uniref:Uncharacterized protein n=1 Tax=Marseillevirus LCMAC101 TaxID=2506602 RepID=A0A481YRP8_9VIRU|nr:MAG: hypothetical protein LCMAC101_04760 [Marseillevirus LCMAC101]
MGNSITIISIPGDETSPIIDLWRSSICERDVKDAAKIVRTVLRGIMNGVHIGLNTKPEYIFLKCPEARSQDLYEILSKEKDMEDLVINLIKKDNRGIYGRFRKDYETGIEITLPPPVIEYSMGICIGSSLSSDKEIGFVINI